MPTSLSHETISSQIEQLKAEMADYRKKADKARAYGKNKDAESVMNAATRVSLISAGFANGIETRAAEKIDKAEQSESAAV